MVDPYGMLMQMSAQGALPEEIARATGWPVDAVQTISEELSVRNASLQVEEQHFILQEAVWG